MPAHPPDSTDFKESFKRAGPSGKTALIISSWFGSGLAPLLPGTFGSLAGLPFVIVLSYLGAVYSGIFILIIIPLAIWASDVSERLLGRDDPPEVVIDEVAGLFLTVFLMPLSWLNIILGFLLFRVFDIFKPFPIGFIDRNVKGGLGIVLDDILAGIYANICLRLITLLMGR
jgi:phosphatidylglycerophosphatase A